MDQSLLVAGWHLLLALLTGVIIGAERQISNPTAHGSLGIRDFSLIALLAFLSSYFQQYNPYIWPIAFSGTMILGLVIFIFESIQKKTEEGHSRAGVTTILSFPTVFLIASLGVFNVGFWLIATLIFALLIILEFKEKWHQFTATIEKHELVDFSILIAIALIITPLIPEGAALKIPLYSFAEHTFAFQSLSVVTFWKVILMMSFMSFISHFITKYIKGRNALLLATFFGGLVSSLATVILFLKGETHTEDTDKPNERLYLAYLSSSTGSLLKDIVILFAIVPLAFFQKMLFPMVSVFLVMVALTLFTFSRATQMEGVKFTNRPLPLHFITKFSVIFSLVMILMVLVRFYLGSGWLVPASFLSGLISSASALASLGEAFKYHEVSDLVMGFGILAALIASIAAKFFVVFQHLGFRQSGRFFLPVLYMVCVGGISFAVSFF